MPYRKRRKKTGRRRVKALSKVRAKAHSFGLNWDRFQTSAIRAARYLSIVVGIALILSVIWTVVYRFADPPGSFVMLERDFSGEKISNPWTPFEEISPHLVRAVIAAEDTRFCLHHGIDLVAIKRAIDDNKGRSRMRGASTISQQTAKNAFLWNGGGWPRKGAEAWMTVLIETFWPKRRVMEVYLNLAEWGDGNFGAEAAARARFGKSAAALTRHEAVLLAAVLPSPNKWRADRPGPYVRRRAEVLHRRMAQVRRDGLDKCVLG